MYEMKIFYTCIKDTVSIKCLEHRDNTNYGVWDYDDDALTEIPHKTTKQLSSTNLIFFQICMHT